MGSSPTLSDGSSVVSVTSFKICLWTLCGISTLFLASRFAVRMSTKGRLMANDYFLVVALPVLFTGCGLLHSIVGNLYQHDKAPASVTPRLTASIESLWIAIYCVKFCFLAQFKFHKPPYAYVNVHLTRYYWVSIGLCSAALLFTIIQPVVLCPSSGKCRYFGSSTVSWEIVVTALDILTDMLVISIPTLLIHMANFTRSYTIINFVFKSLPIVAIAIAATRLALQYNADSRRIEYATMTFLLVIEAAIALIMASMSSYRVVLLDYLADRRQKRATLSVQPKTHQLWSSLRESGEREGAFTHQEDSPIDQPIAEPSCAGVG